MKKRLLLLPFLLISLASCRPIDTSSNSSSSGGSSGGDTPAPAEKEIRSISAAYSGKDVYKVGENFELTSTNLVVTAIYTDNSQKAITTFTTSIDSNYKFKVEDIGQYEVEVTYNLKPSIKTSFNVTVNPATFEDIEIAHGPNKDIYTVGDHFDPTGLVVNKVYSDETRVPITDYTLSKDSSYVFSEGEANTDVNIVVSYQGHEKSFAVHVNPDTSEDVLESIEVTTPPSKTSYLVGEAFDLSGMVITATYEQAGEVLVDTGYTSSVEDGYIFKVEDVGVITSVTIEYESFSDSFPITVSAQETLEQKCDQMNLALPSNIDNPFEARDYLVGEGYTYLVEAQEDNKYFGYDYEDNNVVIYNMTTGNIRNAIYPSSSVGHEVVSYQAREVSNASELSDAVLNVGIGVGNYSTIKVIDNIEVDYTVAITSNEPFEFDFTNKTVTSSIKKDVFRLNGEDVVVNFIAQGGGIETAIDVESKNLGEQDAPACISAMSYKSIVVDNVKLVCNARYGYSIIDSLYAGNESTIEVKNCQNITALTNAICIVKSTLKVNDSYIRGVINISGGNVTIEDTEVSALNRHDDATGLVPDSLVKDIALYLYENNYSRYGNYTVSAPDAIIIFDRRGLYDTYDNPIVTIKDSALIADFEGEVVYGYGLRYIDLELGSKTTVGKVNLDNVTFSSCLTPTNPAGIAGGYNVALPE